MSILTPAPVSTRRFTYIAADRMFVTEASDLGTDFGRVYDDACDVGLTLISERTGRAIVFVVEHYETREGETLWWDLEPAEFHKRSSLDLNVRVYND